MNTDNTIFYTDGHQVMITNDGLKVKSHFYRLNTITQHELAVIRPQRIPTIVLMAVGIVIFLSGTLSFVPESWNTEVNILGFSILVYSLLMAGGIFFLCAGIALLIIQKEKYAVRITTVEGEKSVEKNVVISHSRDYIKEIVYGLNRAYLDLRHKPGAEVKKQFQALG